MKLLLLVSIGLMTSAVASPNLTKSTCQILQTEIKQALETQSIPQQKSQKEMLQVLTPKLDLKIIEKLKTNLNILKYDDHVISYTEIEEYNNLKDLNDLQKLVLTKEEREKLKELSKIKDRNKEQEYEYKDLFIRRDLGKNGQIFTKKNRERLKKLSEKYKEHQARIKLEENAKEELKQYINSNIVEKVKKSPEFHIEESENEFFSDKYSFESTNTKFQFDENDLSRFPFEIYLEGDGYLEFFNKKGTIGRHILSADDSFFYINEKSYSFFERLKGRQLDESLKEILNIEPKSWSDFDHPELEKSFLLNPRKLKSNLITKIKSDVRTKIDHKTGKRTVEFRTFIANENNIWSLFPTNYTSSENMAKLLLPRSCKRFDNKGWLGDLKEFITNETRKTVKGAKRFISNIGKRKEKTGREI